MTKRYDRAWWSSLKDGSHLKEITKSAFFPTGKSEEEMLNSLLSYIEMLETYIASEPHREEDDYDDFEEDETLPFES